MNYDKNSFLAGLSVGRSLKGWSNAGGTDGYAPTVWNDIGVYDYFYIDYMQDVSNFSLGRFLNATIISGATGEITPTNAEQVSGNVYKIYADITNGKQVSVFGREERGLRFTSGEDIPGFEAVFWVDDVKPHQLPYLYDGTELLTYSFLAADNTDFIYVAMHSLPVAFDDCTLERFAYSFENEAVTIVYW